MITHVNKWKNRGLYRRRGVVVVYVWLGIVVFLTAAALAVDLGSQYTHRAEAQRAADAAALAGAYNLYVNDPDIPHRAAKQFARLNGYDSALPGVEVSGQIFPLDETGRARPEWYKVTVSRPEHLYFARIMGLSRGVVGATAIAESIVDVGAPIGGAGDYGQVGDTNLSLFGPYGFYNNGDPYSTKFLPDGSSNPRYDGKGVDFNLSVPASYVATHGNRILLEVFDPDCYNNGGNDAASGLRVDEIRTGHAGSSSDFTTTKYTLQRRSSRTPNAQPEVVDVKTYGNDSATDMQWTPAFNFTYDPNYTYTLNVVTTDGSSENGFDLRAGPPRAADVAFNPANGTSFTADGHIPLNFNRDNGTTTIQLGNVPAEAAGGQLSITKYDTDIGGQSVIYRCVGWDGRTFNGVLAGNGEWVTDRIPLPVGYPGGMWTATYVANTQDTSAWEMSYTGPAPGGNRRVTLVR